VTLYFRHLPVSGGGAGAAFWPFTGNGEGVDGNRKRLAPGAKWSPTIDATKIGSGVYVKYDLELTGYEDVSILDPVIIIKP
jgi:hypothetical protein